MHSVGRNDTRSKPDSMKTLNGDDFDLSDEETAANSPHTGYDVTVTGGLKAQGHRDSNSDGIRTTTVITQQVED